MLSPFFQLLTLRNWPAVHIALFLLCLCVVVVLLVCFFFVWFLRHSDGYLDCVLVLCQFNFCGPPSMKMDNVTALINELTNMTEKKGWSKNLLRERCGKLKY